MILGNLSLALIMVWSISGAGIIGCVLYQLRARKRRQKQIVAMNSKRYPSQQSYGVEQKLMRSKLHPLATQKFTQAFFSKANPSKRLISLQIMSSIFGCITFVVLISLAFGPETLSIWPGISGAILSMIFAGLIPSQYLAYKKKQRQRQIQEGMPDLIDLLVLCVDAGLSLDSAMTRIVGQLQKINPVLSQEIQLTLDEINILPNRSQAFINFQNRAGSDLVTYFVLTVNQTTQYGTPLSATLKTLAEESRRSAMLDMEDRASRLPVLLSIPLILFILPPVVSLSVGPGFILMLRGLGG